MLLSFQIVTQSNRNMFQTKWMSVFVFLIFHTLSIKGFFMIVLHNDIYSKLITKCIWCKYMFYTKQICICNIIVITLNYNNYIINFITILVVKYWNIQEPNMLPFKRINILLFAVMYMAVNNTYADSFESDYIICYIYWIISCMTQYFLLLTFFYYFNLLIYF